MATRKFLDEDFLLYNKPAQRLYHEYAKEIPIIDFHCHLSPELVAKDIRFKNITRAWLDGDHYKWRAMRSNGVDESYCTGNRSDREKFEQWAATVPYTLRNPLYHWTHLELQRYFGIHELLSPQTAGSIFDSCNEKLWESSYSTRNLLRKMNVEIICTTDDPTDDLEYHKQLKLDETEIRMVPAYRPDKALAVGDVFTFNEFVDKLQSVSNISIHNFSQFLDALKQRHDFFSENGCTVSDHGLEQLYVEEYTDHEIQNIFNTIRSGKALTELQQWKFKSALLYNFSIWHWEKGWVQQFHIGAMRNNNSRMMKILGPDTGWDSIGTYSHAQALSKFLDRLDSSAQLTRTIIYNLNPSDNAMVASMIGNFNDGSTAGKIQFGSAWWFMDQKLGMIDQLNALSNMGLLSRFVGMLTDSRSFLSFPRHEYFRRILCNLLGDEIEKGELPSDIGWVGKIVGDICYHNSKSYFNW
ncbi:MAG: glucuronate isomerase [Bacteroidetes bacterium]|nr:MAG: glucuronate isomerase [Bacteroidota bacterium]